MSSRTMDIAICTLFFLPEVNGKAPSWIRRMVIIVTTGCCVVVTQRNIHMKVKLRPPCCDNLGPRPWLHEAFSLHGHVGGCVLCSCEPPRDLSPHLEGYPPLCLSLLDCNSVRIKENSFLGRFASRWLKECDSYWQVDSVEWREQLGATTSDAFRSTQTDSEKLKCLLLMKRVNIKPIAPGVIPLVPHYPQINKTMRRQCVYLYVYNPVVPGVDTCCRGLERT